MLLTKDFILISLVFSYEYPLSVSGSNIEYHIAFNHHVSPLSSFSLPPFFLPFSSYSLFLPPIQDPYSGLISFRIDWLDLLAVQGTLKSLLQHHSSKASILRRSAFFIIQLLCPYMTTGKTIALTRWTFVSKMISLLLKPYK